MESAFINVPIPEATKWMEATNESYGLTPTSYASYPVPHHVKLYQEYVPQFDGTRFTLKFVFDGKKASISHVMTDVFVHYSNIELTQVVYYALVNDFKQAFPDLHPEVLKYIEKKFAEVIDVSFGVKFSELAKTTKSTAEQFAVFADVAVFTDALPTEDPNSVDLMARRLPAVFDMVRYPCECHSAKDTLMSVVISLNDYHKDWDRNRIADWIDQLHDDGVINAEFSPWEENETGLGDENDKD